MIEIENCKICNNKIDPEEYFTNSDKSYYLCSEECADKIKDEDIYQIKYCIAYDECKQLNNLRQKCRFEEKYTGSRFNPYAPMPKHPNFCHPSEVSVIKSNVRLLNFVEESEKRATELNNETLKLTKDNVKLAKAMLIVSIVNLILICVQIYLQIFN
ncbi:hypothetical protein [uncultured Methanobrevibacter sp.]|uniref:hypothetical protein n=1 Tax=uncultured Methanobrevibacter sp. TaxID=253161 RepID=UPI0025EFEDC0|nr:hypothetical protein [uncultured Methanobrevibacter sp.]